MGLMNSNKYKLNRSKNKLNSKKKCIFQLMPNTIFILMNVAKSKAFSHTHVLLGIDSRSKIILDLQYEFCKALTFKDN